MTAIGERHAMSERLSDSDQRMQNTFDGTSHHLYDAQALSLSLCVVVMQYSS